MISRNKSLILKAFRALILCFMITSTSIYGEDCITITCDNITFGKNYSFQLRTDSLDESDNWEYVKGDIPKGIGLDSSGKLFGKLAGTQNEFTGKTFDFWVTVQDKDKPCTTYKVAVHLNVDENTRQAPSDTQKDQALAETQYWNISERLRLIAGFEMVRAIGNSSENKGFIDVYLSQKFPCKDRKFGRRLLLWGNIRLTSVPGQNIGEIKKVFTSGYYESLSSFKLDEIAQAGELLLGLELCLMKHISKDNQRKYNLGFILAGGAIIPMESADEKPIYYKIPEEQKDHYENKEYFALYNKKYNRFYKQFYTGLRLKTYYNNGEEKYEWGLPGMIDLMFGMNQATSGGAKKFLKKTVVRIDGFLPLKIKDFSIYIFGSIVLNMDKRKPLPIDIGTKELVDPTKINIPASLVVLQPFPENDRDYYRIGIGVDLSKIF